VPGISIPGQVDRNRPPLPPNWPTIYRLWGYQEVAPRAIEQSRHRSAAAAASLRNDVCELARRRNRWGLRQKLTAPIGRGASTRLASRPRLLRLLGAGSDFSHLHRRRRRPAHQRNGCRAAWSCSGVALAAADAEAECACCWPCTETLGHSRPATAAVAGGHHGVLGALLDRVPAEQRHRPAGRALTGFQPPGHSARLELAARRRGTNCRSCLRRLRGQGRARVLPELQRQLGPTPRSRRLGHHPCEIRSRQWPSASELGDSGSPQLPRPQFNYYRRNRLSSSSARARGRRLEIAAVRRDDAPGGALLALIKPSQRVDRPPHRGKFRDLDRTVPNGVASTPGIGSGGPYAQNRQQPLAAWPASAGELKPLGIGWAVGRK